MDDDDDDDDNEGGDDGTGNDHGGCHDDDDDYGNDDDDHDNVTIAKEERPTKQSRGIDDNCGGDENGVNGSDPMRDMAPVEGIRNVLATPNCQECSLTCKPIQPQSQATAHRVVLVPPALRQSKTCRSLDFEHSGQSEHTALCNQ
ncbi:hypothetical protein ElyMa_005360000 [Elysia marginata]|uniref:Uncharacterized protein n=1 Tax=Elysia marginata TaxID=1093978 RepID=A0AAV4ECN3_9GAST|nr:hypothetical protein ElyMa_005360000 [Elysia marginata]